MTTMPVSTNTIANSSAYTHGTVGLNEGRQVDVDVEDEVEERTEHFHGGDYDEASSAPS